jgi:excisionase family DNA binding protein
MSTALQDQFFTTQEVADKLRCGPEKILRLIASGKLRAMNTCPESSKPRYLISSAALADFER